MSLDVMTSRSGRWQMAGRAARGEAACCRYARAEVVGTWTSIPATTGRLTLSRKAAAAADGAAGVSGVESSSPAAVQGGVHGLALRADERWVLGQGSASATPSSFMARGSMSSGSRALMALWSISPGRWAVIGGQSMLAAGGALQVFGR